MEKEREFSDRSLGKAMAVCWFEVQVLLLCSGHSCVHCRVPWDAGATVDPSSKGLGFLSSPHCFSFPWAKKISCVKWTAARQRDYMVGNKRCISMAAWEEAKC